MIAREIEVVLARIRDADPSAAAVAAFPDYPLGQLLVELDPDLIETLSGLLEGATGPVALRTGQAEFDALNARLGLAAVKLFDSAAVFYFDEHVNILAAIEAYAKLAGVRFAEPNSYMDGPNIDASKTGGTWHVVVRRAWGDCPSGCGNQQLSFFTVADTEVARVELWRAIDMAEFAALVEGRRWRWQ